MADHTDKTKRQTTFWHSDPPLMSERVREIVSHPVNAERLMDAVLALQRGDLENARFRTVQYERENGLEEGQ
ncbi:hypothetical protein [Lewinella sp. IMCC34183]|uniref:hypothetical protein n=1 Tax=Lewinella sp. IMCC34183 TaxID=2248762 RepID=UPI000E24C64C|nr:hypothetical protein [Lewinella sp. IMCC34183]